MKESPERYTNPFLSDDENDGKFEKSLEPSNDASESVNKAKEEYIDKNVTECQLPENGFNVVKDICVDEGLSLSHGEMIKCDKEHHELSCNPITVKDDLDTQLKTSPLEDCENTCLFSVTEDDNVPSSNASDKTKLFVESNIGPDNSIQNGEEKLESSSNLLNDSIRVLEPDDNGVDDVDQQLSEQQNNVSEVNEPRQTNQTIDIQNEITMEEITTSNSDNVKLATASGPHESAHNHHDMGSSNITVAARGTGESSFSMAGSVSGHITFLGPITSAGSISHRSDGSNSSVRSFAFPILQNEWNSSPVRMAKADPKHSRKHRGWRQALMCCGF
ncbi:putative protein BREAKING OF ASYMMETRY IN THE STOMATAL LINEAGE [Helianthus annuus]|nr:putative protein BREAKING OF ASYMMETRY IN THE STOMATAL LINEAGE [Helianthus annuus]KAJ0828600.1 putative protein BREAKING OF ASYMMETRY IN THE STOMATAL LINEAGE [Helianthus annuus]